MKFEDVFQYIGDIGLYQVLLYIIVGLLCFHNGIGNIGINFAAGYQDHWCKVGRLEDFPHDVQKYVSIPFKEDTLDEYENCYMYDLPYANFTDEQIWNWNRTLMENVTAIDCTDSGWIYDQTDFISTINSEYNLVCGRSWMSQFVSTAYMFGMFVCSLTSGVIADRIGRRYTLLGATLANLGFSIGQVYAPSYTVFIIMRFAIPVFNVTAYLTAFVIVMEFLGPKYRTILGVMYQGFFSIGIMLVSAMGYAIRDHQTFFLATALSLTAFFPLIWIVPESPRWLISRGRYEEAEVILRKVAAVNGRDFPDNITWTEVDKTPTDKVKALSLKDMCQSAVLCKEWALMCLNWFTTSLVYYGLSFNTAAFGSVFLNTFLSGVVEIPALLLCVLCMEKGSKRISNAACLLFAGAFCMACVPVIIVREDLSGLLTVLSTIGKGAITFSFASIYLISAELFPTPVRQKAMGICSVFARVGSMISPYMGPPMEAIWKPMPSMIFGALALFTGCMVFMLPETKGHKIPDTIEEAEYIGNFKKYKKTNHSLNPLDHRGTEPTDVQDFKNESSWDNGNAVNVGHRKYGDKPDSFGEVNQGFQDVEYSTKL